MRHVKLAILLFLLLVAGLVIAQNLDPVKTNLLVGSIEMPLAALLVGTLVIGYALGLLTAALWKVRSWRAQALAARNLAASTKVTATDRPLGLDRTDSEKSILESRR